LIPTILGGGEVIADALVAGTPLIGVGVVTFVAASIVVVPVVRVRVDPGIDMGIGEGVSIGTGGADGAAQPPSETTTIASAINNFFGLI
jgi:hypothetical protein